MNEHLLSGFPTGIHARLNADDDPGLWEMALRTILAEAECLCRLSRGSRPIFAQIGRCSHWLSRHNKGSWFKDVVKFAWPSGYGRKGHAIVHGLPEFDWSVVWEWFREEERWSEVAGVSGKHPLIFRVALPSRTGRHVRAVVHTLWMPGSPTTPKDEFLQGYAFKKVDGDWQCAAVTRRQGPYDAGGAD